MMQSDVLTLISPLNVACLIYVTSVKRALRCDSEQVDDFFVKTEQLEHFFWSSSENQTKIWKMLDYEKCIYLDPQLCRL